MERLAIHPAFRIAFIIVGAACLVYGVVGLSRWVGYKRTQSVIGVAHVAYKDHGEIKYDTNRILMRGTSPVLTVGFLRSSGSLGSVVEPERFLPANAKPGDYVKVLYREQWGNSEDAAVIYSFNLVWRKPVSAALIGGCLVCVGLWFRSRPGHLFRARCENPV